MVSIGNWRGCFVPFYQRHDSVHNVFYVCNILRETPCIFIIKLCTVPLLPELEAATSTTQSESSTSRTPSTEPAEWTIEDVIHYIGVADPALGQHADLFRKHVR